jgi:hypothetical protein
VSILKKIIYLVVFLVTTGFSQAPTESGSSLEELGQPLITNFFAKGYHAHPNNFDVVQDKNGILYFGNLWCVLQFDGTLWRNIYLPDGASCTSLATDKDGTIYVGGRNSIGFLKTDSIGRKHYVSLVDELPKEDRNFYEIWRTVVSAEGIFFSSFEKLFFKKRGEKLQVVKQTPWYAYSVFNNIYVSDKEGIFVYKDEVLQKLPNSEYFTGKFVNGMTHLGDKLLISTSEEGLYLFDGSKAERWNTPINNVIRSYNPTKIENVDDQYLIISTELNGVIITDIKGNIINNFNKATGLAANTVSGFHLDKNKILWLTLTNGIAFIPLFKQVNFIGDFANVPGVPYSSAVYDNKLYLSTSEGLFYKSFSSTRDSKFEREGSINGLVWSLQVIDDKLFCGHAIRAYVIDHGKTESLFDEGTWMFIPSRKKNKILMGTYSGLHYLTKQNGQWKYETKIKGFNESARSFAEDKFGDLWVSYGNRGIFRIRVDRELDSVTQIKKYGEENGLPIKNGNTLAPFNDEILISTAKGIYRYDFEAEQVLPFLELNKILHQHGYLDLKKVIPEPPDKIWAVDKQGAFVKLRITQNEVTALLTTELLRGNTVSDFEHINPQPHAAIIGTLDGFAIYKQQKVSKQEDTLKTYISKVETVNRALMDGYYTLKEIEEPIPFTENALKFTFASNSYQDLNSNQYQYYLEGFEDGKKWSASTYLPYKEYTNLHAGKYKLHVRVINFENRVSGETTLSFVILPPWYKSWWANILYGILFLAFNYAFYKRIIFRIEREKKRIAQEEQHNLWVKQKEWEEITIANKKAMMLLEEEKIASEKAALEQKGKLIESEKEKEREILAIQKDKFEADLRHKNNELTSLALHITQKNEMLGKISNQISKAIAETGDDSTIKNLKEIKALIQKGLNASNEWEKFSEHFDSVHEGFLKRLKQTYPDLSTSTLKLCAFIKMRLSSKEIATLMNTAPDSVLKARYRLRSKFNLEKETGLEEFLNNF